MGSKILGRLRFAYDFILRVLGARASPFPSPPFVPLSCFAIFLRCVHGSAVPPTHVSQEWLSRAIEQRAGIKNAPPMQCYGSSRVNIMYGDVV
jgi:hypothetical protein